MKNKKLFISGVSLLALAVITSVGVAGTYAKYTTSLTGSDDATVAKWAWKINGEAITSGTTDIAKFNLFKDSELLDEDCSTSETDVKSGKKLIAPGTCGVFTVSIENLSEISASVGYELTLDNDDNVPIVFSTDPTSATSWKSMEDFSKSASKNILVNATGEGANKVEFPLYWKWDFDGDDTALGFGTTTDGTTTYATVEVDATLTLDQIN